MMTKGKGTYSKVSASKSSRRKPSTKQSVVRKTTSYPIESAKIRKLLSPYKSGTPPLNEIMKGIKIKQYPTISTKTNEWGGYKDTDDAMWHKVTTIDGENYYTDNHISVGSSPFFLIEAHLTEKQAEKRAEELRKNVGIDRYGFSEVPWNVRVSKAHGMTKHGIRRLNEKSIMPKNFVEFYAIYRY